MSPDADRPADSSPRRRARRPRRRRLPVLVVIVLAGLVAVAAAFALASALDDDRPHGPYLIGAWTFGDRDSLAAAVKAGALDEVSVDWLQSRADGSVVAPRLDTDFIAEAERKDCRVFVTLTDYDESDAHVRLLHLGGDPRPRPRRGGGTPPPWPPGPRPTTSPAWTSTGRPSRGRAATSSPPSSRSSRAACTTTAASSPSTSTPSSRSPAAGTAPGRRTGSVSAGRSTSSA